MSFFVHTKYSSLLKFRIRWPNKWSWGVLFISFTVISPMLALFFLGVSTPWLESVGFEATFSYFRTTLLLVIGAVTLGGGIALACAWLVTMYRFPGRELFSTLLLLTFAMPAYVLAYVYADLSSEWANVVGFPDFRSLGGAIVIMALTTYPYIYVFAKAAFWEQSCHIYSSARVLGCTPWQAFLKVSLPIARSGISIGVALAAMEILNDIAVAEHFGLNTLGIGIYDVWFNRNDTISAVQLSMTALLLVVILVALENYGRSRQRYYTTRQKCYCCDRPYELSGVWRIAAPLFCATPVILGLLFPLTVLAIYSWESESWGVALGGVVLNSLLFSSVAAGLTLVLGCVLAVSSRLSDSHYLWIKPVAKLAQSGYAFPGTILALGVLSITGAWGAQIGLLLLFAISVRFLVISAGAFEAGLDRISPSMSSAARGSGAGLFRVLTQIYFPLFKPAAIGALLLLFIDILKELPMTLILRPLNFETLSIHVYQYASDEELAQAAPAALLIVFLCLCALVLFDRAMTEIRNIRCADQPH